MKLKIFLYFLLILGLWSCQPSPPPIEGTWIHIKTVDRGSESLEPKGYQYGTYKLEFTEDGQMFYLDPNNKVKKVGNNSLHFQLNDRTLSSFRIEHKANGTTDTVHLQDVDISLSKDELVVYGEENLFFYKRL